MPPSIVFQSSEDDEKILAQSLESLPPVVFQEEEPAPPVFKKTKKSRLFLGRPDATLDLHGKTRDNALTLVEKFITRSHKKRLHAVLIITGKGYGSGKKGPVLNKAVRTWLEENGQAWVKDFEYAPPKHGGTGALLVYLQ